MRRCGMCSLLFLLVVSGLSGCNTKTRGVFECSRDDECLPEEACIDNVCKVPECKRDEDCPGDERCKEHRCVEPQTCRDENDCTGGEICMDGTCVCGSHASTDCREGDVWWFDSCGRPEEVAVTCDQGCEEGSCTGCTPDCGARVCGPDPVCGTLDCGTCPAPETCDAATGTCVCIPDCTGRACGPDPVCGTLDCGTCPAPETCDGATGTCVCVPDCSDRECGLDPVCGVACPPGCDTAAGEQCTAQGHCVTGCGPGERRCSADGFGFEACGPDPQNPALQSFGPRIPCQANVQCQDGNCQRAGCLRTEVLFLLDRSSSMLESGTWDWVVEGLATKLYERDALNWFGFRQFPSGGGCEADDVLPPDLDNADTILSHLEEPTSLSATPIARALANLSGMYGDPNDGQAVLLITDGEETCDTQDEAIHAAASLHRTGILVYVIALTTAANREFLDELAEAGGTGTSRLVTNQAELEENLEHVFYALRSCRCTQEDTWCRNDELYLCNEDGLAMEFALACPLGCADDLDCVRCEPAETSCDADVLYRCSSDGLSFQQVELCEYGCADATSCRQLPPVDIVWVVDDSGSMQEEQSAVRQAIQSMTDVLDEAGCLWRMAVTVSDSADDGCLVTPGFTNDVSTITSNLLQGVDGSGLEYSLQMGIRAISRSLPCSAGEDPYLLRCDSFRVVILLTDEDDQTIEDASGGDNYSGEPDAATVNSLAQSYLALSTTVFAIAPGVPSCPSAYNPSTGIEAVMEAIGAGTVYSVCDTDQTQNMHALGQDILEAAGGT